MLPDLSPTRIADRLFELSPAIRYVAVNQDHRIVEMAQNPKRPSRNPAETDRMEELLVNPVLLDLVTRRGELDLSGVRYVVVRYGVLDELVFPYGNGHLSIGVEPGADLMRVAEDVEKYMRSSTPGQP